MPSERIGNLNISESLFHLQNNELNALLRSLTIPSVIKTSTNMSDAKSLSKGYRGKNMHTIFQQFVFKNGG